jgi:predicted AAA+ superfamily ATPase
MSNDSLRNTLLKHRDEFERFKELPYWQRKQEAQLIEALDSRLIKVVLGPRRSGKSRLIQHTLRSHNVAYINFEDELLVGHNSDDILEAAAKVYPNATHWYFDEIQMLSSWETVLNKCHRRGLNLIVTGSNAKLLSSEIATALTGRHLAVELLPFSYSEFLNAIKKGESWQTFKQYLEQGGFPEVIQAAPIERSNYLRALFDSLVLTDIVTRKKIRNPEYLRNTLSLIVNNVTARMSARSLSRALQGTPSAITVEKYIQYVLEAYLVETTRPFSPRVKESIRGERKSYLIDTGFITALSSGVMPVLGKQLENAVYLTLRRRGLKGDLSLFHYRSEDGKEVDFVVRDRHETTELIQVCLDMSSIDTRTREQRTILSAAKSHPNARLTIVTACESEIVKGDSGRVINIVPAYEFCR